MQPQKPNTEKESFSKWFLSSKKNKIWAICFTAMMVFVQTSIIQSYVYSGSLVSMLCIPTPLLIYTLYWVLTFNNYKNK